MRKQGGSNQPSGQDDDFIGAIKIGNNQYIHILDKNSNTTRQALFSLISSTESK